MIALTTIPAWVTDAACAKYDPEDWYPVPGSNWTAIVAKKVCVEHCPVREKCLTWAMETEADATGGRHGIWGGLSPDERTTLAREAAS